MYMFCGLNNSSVEFGISLAGVYDAAKQSLMEVVKCYSLCSFSGFKWRLSSVIFMLM
jgi:hypothetical protein